MRRSPDTTGSDVLLWRTPGGDPRRVSEGSPVGRVNEGNAAGLRPHGGLRRRAVGRLACVRVASLRASNDANDRFRISARFGTKERRPGCPSPCSTGADPDCGPSVRYRRNGFRLAGRRSVDHSARSTASQQTHRSKRGINPRSANALARMATPSRRNHTSSHADTVGAGPPVKQF